MKKVDYGKVSKWYGLTARELSTTIKFLATVCKHTENVFCENCEHYTNKIVDCYPSIYCLNSKYVHFFYEDTSERRYLHRKLGDPDELNKDNNCNGYKRKRWFRFWTAEWIKRFRYGLPF